MWFSTPLMQQHVIETSLTILQDAVPSKWFPSCYFNVKKFHNVAVSIDECASSDRSRSIYRVLLIYVGVSEPSSSVIFDYSGQIQNVVN